MSNHLIIDFETFGQDVWSCPIINMSYYVFDWNRLSSDNPYEWNELLSNIKTLKLDVKEQCVNYGYSLTEESINFWKNLPPEVSSQIKPSKNDLSLFEFYETLIFELKDMKIDYMWSRANTFDPVIFYSRCKKVDEKYGSHFYQKLFFEILKHWRVRDVRTFIDTKTDFKLTRNAFIPIEDEKKWYTMYKEHDSICDVAADILRIQKIVRFENGDEHAN